MTDYNWYGVMVLCSTQKDLADPDLTMKEAEETGGGAAKGSDGEEFGDDVPDPSRSATSESSSVSALSELVFMLDDIAHIISCLYMLSVAMRQPVPQDRHRKYAEINLSHYCHTTNFLITSLSLKSSPTQSRFSLSDSEVQTRNGDSISNIGSSITRQFQGRSDTRDQQFQLIRQQFQGLKITIPIAHVDTVNYGADPVHVQEEAGTVITAAKTSTAISIVPKSAVLRTQPVLDTIEAESDGGQTATSFGTVMETGKVKLLKVPDPPDADVVFAGSAFQCPYCYCLIVKDPRAWRYASISPHACHSTVCVN